MIPATRLAAITLASVAAGVHAVLIAQQASIWWGYGALIAAIAVVRRGDSRRCSPSGRPIGVVTGVDRRHGHQHAPLRRQPDVRLPVGPGPANAPRFTDPLHSEGHPNYAALTDRAEPVGLLDLGCLVAEIALVVLLVSMLPERRRRFATNALLRHRRGTVGAPVDRSPRLIRRIATADRAWWCWSPALLFALQPIRVHADSMRADAALGRRAHHRPALARTPRAAPRRDRVANSPAGRLVVKRVAAVGGDSVGIEDGVLVVNGKQQREKYVDYASIDGVYFGPVDVPPRRRLPARRQPRQLGGLPRLRRRAGGRRRGSPARPDLATDAIAVRRPR